MRHLIADLPHVCDLIILPQGLHNKPRLRRELQATVDGAEARPKVEVIARAHDCVALFLGNKERYAAYLREHPITFWYTPGWIKSYAPPDPDRTAVQAGRPGFC